MIFFYLIGMLLFSMYVFFVFTQSDIDEVKEALDDPMFPYVALSLIILWPIALLYLIFRASLR